MAYSRSPAYSCSKFHNSHLLGDRVTLLFPQEQCVGGRGSGDAGCYRQPRHQGPDRQLSTLVTDHVSIVMPTLEVFITTIHSTPKLRKDHETVSFISLYAACLATLPRLLCTSWPLPRWSASYAPSSRTRSTMWHQTRTPRSVGDARLKRPIRMSSRWSS
jgi:hypothetical protein